MCVKSAVLRLPPSVTSSQTTVYARIPFCPLLVTVNATFGLNGSEERIFVDEICSGDCGCGSICTAKIWGGGGAKREYVALLVKRIKQVMRTHKAISLIESLLRVGWFIYPS